MRRAAQGEKAAYAEINELYRPTVLDYFRSPNGRCHQHDLDDMIQEVFKRGWEKKEKFTGKSSVKTWLIGFAGNIYLEARRRENRENERSKNNKERFGVIVPTPTNPDDILENTEQIQSLNQAISRLSKEQQEIIKLHYHHGLSSKQASETLNCSEKAIECRLCRIRQKLKERLEKAGIRSS